MCIFIGFLTVAVVVTIYLVSRSVYMYKLHVHLNELEVLVPEVN